MIKKLKYNMLAFFTKFHFHAEECEDGLHWIPVHRSRLPEIERDLLVFPYIYREVCQLDSGRWVATHNYFGSEYTLSERRHYKRNK